MSEDTPGIAAVGAAVGVKRPWSASSRTVGDTRREGEIFPIGILTPNLHSTRRGYEIFPMKIHSYCAKFPDSEMRSDVLAVGARECSQIGDAARQFGGLYASTTGSSQLLFLTLF